MHRIYSALIDIVAAAIFIVPLLALYGKISLRSLKQTLIYIVFAFYLVAVLSLVGFPSVLSLNLDFTINIIPLVDMISDFVNACLNVLLFVPLGFLLCFDFSSDVQSIGFIDHIFQRQHDTAMKISGIRCVKLIRNSNEANIMSMEILFDIITCVNRISP